MFMLVIILHLSRMSRVCVSVCVCVHARAHLYSCTCRKI